MRKVIFFMLTSLNGFYERAPWAIDWHHAGDPEFNEFALAQLDSADLMVFGRKTYEGMASYWSSADAVRDDAEVAGRMNAKEKVVFSRTLSEASWENTRLVRGDAPDEIARLRQATGRNIIVMGSGDLATSLAQRGLIDELRIMINPIALPSGRPLFSGLEADLPLRLVDTRVFGSGNVLLTYAPKSSA